MQQKWLAKCSWFDSTFASGAVYAVIDIYHNQSQLSTIDWARKHQNQGSINIRIKSVSGA